MRSLYWTRMHPNKHLHSKFGDQVQLVTPQRPLAAGSSIEAGRGLLNGSVGQVDVRVGEVARVRVVSVTNARARRL